jgi:hypothetical protein
MPAKDDEVERPDPALPPNLEQRFNSTKGKPVQWKLAKYREVELLKYVMEKNCTFYGYTEIRWPRTEAVAMTFGCDDQATVWVNGQQAWKSEDGPRSWSPDLGTKTVTLNHGLNRIFFQVDNMGGAMAVSVAIASPSDE